MLKGDLASTPVPMILRQLADGVATGCLHVQDPVGEQAKVYLRGGLVYAVTVPGRRPQLGARLISSGALAPEALAEALEAQRTELQGWRLGELLVHLGYVDQPVVEAFVQEQLQESTSDLLPWAVGSWQFRVNERTREDVAPPTPVADLLTAVATRRAVWRTITETVHGPGSVPVLSASGVADAETAIDPEAWSLLCKVDGARTLAELAGECGFTLFEAGQVVHTLVAAGLLDVEEATAGPEPTTDTTSVASRLAAAFAPSYDERAGPTYDDPAAPSTPVQVVPGECLDVDETVDRVSAALSALLGPVRDDALFASRPRPPKVAPPLTETERVRAVKKAERAERDAARRVRDAEDLMAAQAEIEAARAVVAPAYADDHEAEIVDLSARREQAEADGAHALLERVEAERLAAEEVDAQRVADEAAAAEAQRVEAQRVEAERAEAERAEAQRVEAERAEAERAEAEQVAAEHEAAAHAEAHRLAEEAAAAEAQRLADETQRLEAERRDTERLAAEAQRLENQRLENQRLDDQRADAERLAAQQQAAAQAEAQRITAETAAAAEAQRAEAKRAAAERFEAEQARQRAQVEEQLRQAAVEQAAAEAESAQQVQQAQAVAEARVVAEAEARALADDEQQRQVQQQRQQAASAFAELSAAAGSAPDVTDLPSARSSQDDNTPATTWVDDGPMNYGVRDTDTAALMRELSSLGLDDDPAPVVSARPAAGPPRTPVATASSKKKKGLFGRG